MRRGSMDGGGELGVGVVMMMMVMTSVEVEGLKRAVLDTRIGR
jgi:hypothetical protein